MSYTIKSIQEKDCLEIFELSSKVFNIYERFKNLEKVKEFIDNGLICKYNDKIIAYITFGVRKGQYDPFDDNHFIIMCLAVDPDFQGKNIGGILIREIKNYFNKTYQILHEKYKIKNKIYLQVRKSNNNAIKLYLKEKFKPFQILYDYYVGPTEDGIHMIYEF